MSFRLDSEALTRSFQREVYGTYVFHGHYIPFSGFLEKVEDDGVIVNVRECIPGSTRAWYLLTKFTFLPALIGSRRKLLFEEEPDCNCLVSLRYGKVQVYQRDIN